MIRVWILPFLFVFQLSTCLGIPSDGIVSTVGEAHPHDHDSARLTYDNREKNNPTPPPTEFRTIPDLGFKNFGVS